MKDPTTGYEKDREEPMSMNASPGNYRGIPHMPNGAKAAAFPSRITLQALAEIDVTNTLEEFVQTTGYVHMKRSSWR